MADERFRVQRRGRTTSIGELSRDLMRRVSRQHGLRRPPPSWADGVPFPPYESDEQESDDEQPDDPT